MAEPGGPDWTNEWGAPVFMRYEPGSEPVEKCDYLPCIRRGENQGPFLTQEEEKRRFKEQVKSSKGFDINFEEFRCGFNYVPVDFDENYYLSDTDTTRGVIERLSRESLDRYSKRTGKGFEFVEVIKANTHPTAKRLPSYGLLFLLYLKQVPLRQLKPEKKVHSIEPSEKEDAKKARLTEEASAA
ncbi:Cystatin/monellin superfamily protein [Raphanus sativus]|nr:Cystatin/monellin superfamily protein [Raphanus sativus]